MKSNKVQSSLEYWHNRLSQEYGKNHILNITLYGSQNYNIDTLNSDVDVKAIYIPSLEDAILKDKRISIELHNDKNEHCELKDIREMCKMYQKQNLNFLETLFTEYRWDNPKYKKINNAFKSKAEGIAHYNKSYGIKNTCGQAISTIKQFRNNPDDLKKFAKIIYLYLYLNKYINEYDYKSCLYINTFDKFLDFPAHSLLIGLKLHDFTYFDSYQLMKENKILNFLEEFFTNTLKNIKPINSTTDIQLFLKEIAFDAIMHYENIK